MGFSILPKLRGLCTNQRCPLQTMQTHISWGVSKAWPPASQQPPGQGVQSTIVTMPSVMKCYEGHYGDTHPHLWRSIPQITNYPHLYPHSIPLSSCPWRGQQFQWDPATAGCGCTRWGLRCRKSCPGRNGPIMSQHVLAIRKLEEADELGIRMVRSGSTMINTEVPPFQPKTRWIGWISNKWKN